jgi:tetratricopeptide (TPR) repeat protein
MPLLFMDAETQRMEFYLKVLGWMHARRKPLLIGVIVAAALGLMAAFFAWRNAENEAAANALFFALPSEHGPRGMPSSPAPLLDLAQHYGGTTAGKHAELLAAESLFTQGKYPEAEHAFSRFIDDHPADELVPQAKVGIAACVEAQGRNMDAVQKYHEIILAYPGEANIVSPVKLTVARLYDEANKPQDALNFYTELARLLSQNPYDPWASEARERRALLLAKHPELAPSQASAAPSGFSVSQAAKAAASATNAAGPKPSGTNQGVNLLTIPGLTPKTTTKP